MARFVYLVARNAVQLAQHGAGKRLIHFTSTNSMHGMVHVLRYVDEQVSEVDYLCSEPLYLRLI